MVLVAGPCCKERPLHGCRALSNSHKSIPIVAGVTDSGPTQAQPGGQNGVLATLRLLSAKLQRRPWPAQRGDSHHSQWAPSQALCCSVQATGRHCPAHELLCLPLPCRALEPSQQAWNGVVNSTHRFLCLTKQCTDQLASCVLRLQLKGETANQAATSMLFHLSAC